MSASPRTLPQAGEPLAGPPLWLPLFSLAQAVVWLGLGALALVAVAPDLAAGNTAMPRVFATTHLFTLGALGAATLGALHQFIPVVTGIGLRHPRAATWSVWVHPAGVAVLAGSMWWWHPVGQMVGWVILFLAVGLGSWNILPARRRARANAYVGAFVSLAHSALGLGMVIAAVRIGDGLGWWTTWREGQLLAHFHLGWIGYGTLTIAGIGSKMLPAFLGLAEHADAQRVPPAYRRIGWLLSLGLVALAIGAPFRIAWLTWVGAALLATGVGFHLAVLIGYFARRKGPMDPAITAIAAAVECYAVALGLGLLAALVRPPATRIWAAYGVAAIAGWLTLMIVGVMHRIGPRLLAAFLARRGAGITMAQRGGQVLDLRLAWGSVAGLASGAILMPGAILSGLPSVVRGTALLYAVGAALLVSQVARLIRMGLARPVRRAP